METNNKAITLGLLTLVILLGAMLLVKTNKINDLQSKGRAYQIDIEYLEKEAKVWRSKDSTWRAEKETHETTIDALKYSQKLQVDSLIKAIDGLKKANQVKAIKTVSLQTSGSFETPVQPVINIDNNKSFTYSFEDKWSSFQGTYNNGIIDMQYQVTDSVTFVTYKEKGLFNRQIVTQGISHNPNTKITGLNDVKIQTPKPILTVSVGMSGVYTNGGISILPSISVGYPIFSIYKKK